MAKGKRGKVSEEKRMAAWVEGVRRHFAKMGWGDPLAWAREGEQHGEEA